MWRKNLTIHQVFSPYRGKVYDRPADICGPSPVTGMDIELEDMIAQKKKLERCADEPLSVRAELICHKNLLDEVWKAREMRELDEMIDRLNRRIRWIADEMNSIGYDILRAYEDLYD